MMSSEQSALERSENEASRRGESAACAPASPAHLAADALTRDRAGVWKPVLLKVAGIFAVMTVLTGLGAASLKARAPRGAPESQSKFAGLGGDWLSIDTHAAGPASSATPSAPKPSESSKDSAPMASSEARDSAPKPSSADAPCTNAAEHAASGPSSAITPDGKVILNLATASDLTRLPGVGERRAQAIIELRTKLKKFKRATDLLRVRGIGPKSLAKLSEHFVLDAPVALDAGTKPGS
jgi:competence protein ComEA